MLEWSTEDKEMDNKEQNFFRIKNIYYTHHLFLEVFSISWRCYPDSHLLQKSCQAWQKKFWKYLANHEEQYIGWEWLIYIDQLALWISCLINFT